MVENELESILKRYFQQKIEIRIGEELIKSGQFLLFQNSLDNSNYFFALSIKRKDKIDLIKIPYPYAIDEYEDEGLLYLDYRTQTLVKNNVELLAKLNAYTATQLEEKSKFFDKIVEIQFTDAK
jgi:hypothetical protein